MSCDVGEVTESLENEQSSFSKLSVTSPTSQLILQPFPCFTYVTAHSPTLPLLHLRHSSFSNPSFASPTSQDFHLCHLASRLWCFGLNKTILFIKIQSTALAETVACLPIVQQVQGSLSGKVENFIMKILKPSD